MLEYSVFHFVNKSATKCARVRNKVIQYGKVHQSAK